MEVQQNSMIDTLQRPLRDLRVSVTDRCNFRCSYCMPAEIFDANYQFLSRKELLSFEEMTRLIRIFVKLGVEKIRITGGEPLMRKDLAQFIEMVDQIDGVKDIAMTTNGSMLAQHARTLKEAGLQRVTVSLDSMNSERFGRINGRGIAVDSVLQGIDAAAQEGLPVKINMVVQKGVNEHDILPMAHYFREKGHTLRFIEFMDVGNSNGWRLDDVLPSREIVEMIDKEMPLEPAEANYYGEVAKRYRYKDSDTEIGFISSVTGAFCSTCTRARISAQGSLYTCLFASKGTDLKAPIRNGASDDETAQLIRHVWERRDDRYSEERLHHTNKEAKDKIEMSYIGG